METYPYVWYSRYVRSVRRKYVFASERETEMDNLMTALKDTFKGERKLNERRKYQSCGVILSLVHLCMTILFYIAGVRLMFIYNALTVLFYIGITVITGRVYRFTYVFIATFIEILLHSVLASLLVGWNWGFMSYTLGLVPLSFYIAYTVPYFKQNFRIPLIYSAIVFVCYFFVREYCVYKGSILEVVVSEVFIDRVYLFNIILTFCFLWVVALLFSLEVYYMQHHLESENTSLEQLANYDPLTKLMNRRSMDIYLRDAIERAEQKGEMLCIIMTDIDDFKKINDTYGHAAGDIVLEEVSGIILEDVRDEDCVCRWGGEEILILIRSAQDTAANVAQRICKDIAASRIDIGEEKIAITMTLGVTQYRENDSVDTIVERADRSMYKGKKNGKNQVVCDFTVRKSKFSV